MDKNTGMTNWRRIREWVREWNEIVNEKRIHKEWVLEEKQRLCAERKEVQEEEREKRKWTKS